MFRVKMLQALLLIAVIGCGTHAPPQVLIAHYSNDVLSGVEIAQKGVISLNTTGQLDEPTTRKILDGIKLTNEKAARLSAVLKIYDAAADSTAKSLALRDVSAAVNEVNAAFSAAFNVALPAIVLGQIHTLISNVTKTILDIQLEIAKFKAVTA